MTRPGARLRILSRRIFDDSIMERLVDPAIADLQHEYDQAIRCGLVWRARWVRIAGYVAVWKLIAASMSRTSTRSIHEWARADDGAVGRTIGHSCVGIAAVMALLMWPTLNGYLRRAPDHKIVWMVIYLVPQGLMIAIPLGLMFGVLSGLRGRVVTPRLRRSVTAMTIVCSVAAFILAAWAVPAANQAFRELMTGIRLGARSARVARGFNEMTLRELARTPAQNIWIVSATANRLAFEFHYRLALAFGSLALGPFAMAVATAWRGAYRLRGGVLVGFLAGSAYYALLFWTRQAGNIADQQARVPVAWIPNLVFLAMTLLLFRRALTAKTLEVYQ